jgi:hypothetical protein
MRIGINIAKLREGTPAEYLWRFVFGGLVTVLASLVAKHYGPLIGGLFLAFPGIFAPGLSMTEKHAVEHKAQGGADGTLFARAEASVEAAGASAGALGLAAFALVLWKGLPAHSLPILLPLAGTVWLAVSLLFWGLRKRI